MDQTNQRTQLFLRRSLPLLVILALILSACSLNEPFGNSSSSPTPTAAPGTPGAQALSQSGTTTAGSTTSGQPAPGGTGPAGLPALPEQQAVIQVVQHAQDAVVTVVNKLNPTRQGYAQEALGTGVIIDKQGHIFTNNHVIAGSAPGGLSVIFADGANAPAQLVGADALTDLAVLQVQHSVTTTAPLGNSDQLQVGQFVVAIGSALGNFRNTVTMGVVSGLNRTLPGATDTDIEPMIQTDAAINHGNSGGPLLDLGGNVIGINTAAVTSAGSTGDIAQGLGFAIPVNTVKMVTSQLMTTGNVQRPYLGIASEPVSLQLASYYNLTDEKGNLLDHGALVEEVTPGGPADQAGVQPGDVIVGMNDKTVDDNNPLISVLLSFKPGDKVTLHIIRNGKALTVDVPLGTRPPDQTPTP